MNIINIEFYLRVNCDAPYPYQLVFQDPASIIMSGIIQVHNLIFGILLFIFVLVSWLLYKTIIYFYLLRLKDLTSTGRFRVWFYKLKNINFKNNIIPRLYILFLYWFSRTLNLNKQLKLKTFTRVFAFKNQKHNFITEARIAIEYWKVWYTKYDNNISVLRDIVSFLNVLARKHRLPYPIMTEISWTIIPILILIIISVPSFTLLYSLDELMESFFNLKVIGVQWYWKYEYYFSRNNDYHTSFTFNSDIPLTTTMLSVDDVAYLNSDAYKADNTAPASDHEDEYIIYKRLLTTVSDVYLPTLVPLNILVTSYDVIHSWAVPAFGIKSDAISGRLNQNPLFITREGQFFGQCSEICGAAHGFMPISMVAMDPYDFFVILQALAL